MIIWRGNVVANLRDVCEIVRRELGDDLADFMEEAVSGINEEYNQLESRLENLECAEELAREEWMNIVRDARDALDEALYDVEHEMFDSFKVPKKRLNRKAFEKIMENLDNVL